MLLSLDVSEFVVANQTFFWGLNDCSNGNSNFYSFLITCWASNRKKEESDFELIRESVLNVCVVRGSFMIFDYFELKCIVI